jgi:hypothetical protein
MNILQERLYLMLSTCHKHFPVLSSFINYHWVCNWSNTVGVTSGAFFHILDTVSPSWQNNVWNHKTLGKINFENYYNY